MNTCVTIRESRYSSPYHSLLLEIDPNGGHEAGVKCAIGVLIEETRFPDSGVAQRQKLDQIIVIHFGGESAARKSRRSLHALSL